MNATELTVGDWVNVKTRDRQTNKDVVKTGRIVSIEPYFKHIGVAFTPEDAKRWFGFGFPPEYIEPLPLTAEILEKNGFVRFGTSYVLEGEHFWLENPSSPDDYKDNYWLRIGGKDHNILYVHQLQHALRLAGVNKEITI